jgi:hypothetical protein
MRKFHIFSTFKDQYMGRSEMWRLKQFLTNSCVYVNKKIEYCDTIRCQVYEMWSQGERVACGVINEETKVRQIFKFPNYFKTFQKFSSDRLPLQHVNGLPLHPNVFRDVGL